MRASLSEVVRPGAATARTGPRPTRTAGRGDAGSARQGTCALVRLSLQERRNAPRVHPAGTAARGDLLECQAFRTAGPLTSMTGRVYETSRPFLVVYSTSSSDSAARAGPSTRANAAS